jgi:23S rRNA pseudouridine1911/1915/1917 synthase
MTEPPEDRPSSDNQDLSEDELRPPPVSELSSEPVLLTVEARAHGWRLDHYLCRLFPNYSRGLFQSAINQEAVLVNNLAVKPSRRLRVNDRVSVKLPEQPDSRLPPEDIPLDVLYEDSSLIVLNKPPDMIVHPGKGNYRGTLAGALQFHFDQLSDLAGSLRPGIVHRLDRDTSGVLVVAKDNQVHHRLSAQFERRDVRKEYLALVWRHLEFESDFIETYVRVHPKHREKMLVCEPGGNARQASTFYEVIERFHPTPASKFTYVRLLPKTGRTHQLRVHMQHIGHPIVADRMYGGRSMLNRSDLEPNIPEEEDAVLIPRQALHAHRLSFNHPETGKPLTFEAPLPADFQETLEALRRAETLP